MILFSGRHSPPALARFAFGSLPQLFGVVLASAADLEAMKFDVPAGSAEQTFKQFSAQSAVQLAYATDLVRGVQTNAIRGSYQPVEALEKMVAGTPLTVVRDEKPGAYAINRISASNGQRKRPVDPTAPAQSAPKTQKKSQTTMKPKNPTTLLGAWIALALAPAHAGESAVGNQTSSSAASDKKKDTTVLSVFEVKADKDEGYRSTQTLQGSATLTNLRDTPNSISVINRELIDDLIATDVRELSFYMVTGEAGTNAQGVFGEGHVFRGITGNIALRDGVTWFTPVDS